MAEGDTRTIALHHVHTKEDLTVTYKRNGKYDPEALKKINWILRDWRRNEEVATDPQLLDIIWEMHREVGAKQPIHIICGYRAPQTNAMLRRRSDGVAQFSQHTLGKAIDFFIPGVPLEELRNIGLRLQRGGIGFYPSSGSPFVHLDVASVRHWPSISREELARIFPNGRTVHIPSDGQPLPGYALALADIERRGNHPSAVSLNAARSAGVLTASAQRSATNPIARFLGFGRSEDEEMETTSAIAAAPKAAPASIAAAKPAARNTPQPVDVAVALPPKIPTQPSAVGIPWPDAAMPLPMLPERALAYAPLPGPEMSPRPTSPPPSETVVRLPLPPLVTAAVPPAYIPRATSIVVRQPDGKPVIVHTRRTQTGEPFDDPWLRAAILAPDFSHHMTAVAMGTEDFRSLNAFMHKPSSLVTMAFAPDPNPGLLVERFSGQAVVFVATTTFNARTAMLQ